MDIAIDQNSNLYINNFWITINKNNDLDSVYIEKNKDESDKEKKVTISEKLDKKVNRKLQAKLIDDEIIKYIENDEELYDDDEDDLQMIENYIHNPETKYINYDNDEINSDEEEPYYDINGLANYSENSLDLSNYEFYYFGSDSNDLKYYTTIINDNPFYRISYYESTNEIKLNIIGESIKTYKILFDKEINQLTFVKHNINLTQNI